ncbi:MAG: hypothetical protein RRY53_08450, partial [Pseudoflavonifractor sp.]
WSGSQMRSTVLGSGSTPTSPAGNTLLAALPADLRAIMKPCTKYSDNTGGGADTASYVTATTEYLFLLSKFEYDGSAGGSNNSAEKTFQAQYPYYKAGNSHDKTDSSVNAWTRSVYLMETTNFVISVTGGFSYGSAYFSFALAPGFCA